MILSTKDITLIAFKLFVIRLSFFLSFIISNVINFIYSMLKIDKMLRDTETQNQILMINKKEILFSVQSAYCIYSCGFSNFYKNHLVGTGQVIGITYTIRHHNVLQFYKYHVLLEHKRVKRHILSLHFILTYERIAICGHT